MAAKPAIGIYITDDYIEVSQVDADLTNLRKFNHIPLSGGIVVNGEIKNPQGLSQALINLLSTAKPQGINAGSDVVVGISDSRVFLREITLPRLTGRDIDEAIDWQVKSLLPVLPGEMETDRMIIGKDSSGLVEVLIAAISKEIVKSYLNLVNNLGLNVISIEPAVFSTLRIIDPRILKGKNQLVVFSGDGYIEFIYTTGGNPRFSDYLSVQDVEAKGGIIASVKDYITFANSKHPERPVQEIVLSGFSPSIADLAKRLGETKVPVVMAVSRLAASTAKDHELLHTSHGLSLKTAVNETSLNLMPADFRLGRIRDEMVSMWKVVLSLLTGLGLLGLIGMFFFWRYNVTRVESLKNLARQYQYELTSSSSAQIAKRADDINKLTDRLILLRQATGGEDTLLRVLQGVTPQGITLTSFIYSRNLGGLNLVDKDSSWIITGKAVSRQSVLDFFESLIRIDTFSNGLLYFGSLEKETDVIFRIASPVR